MKKLAPKSAAAWQAFRDRVEALGGEVLEPEWLGNGKPHRVRCRNGHDCAPWPLSVQQGRGICRACVGRDPSTARSAFRDRVEAQGGTVLEPEWLGVNTPHLIRCPEGHTGTPRPGDVRRGGGICRVCAGKDPAAAWTAFRDRVAEMGGTVLEPEWLGANTPHRVRCAEGHDCRPWPGAVRQGQGICLTCVGQDPDAAWQNFHTRVAELGGTVIETKWLGNGKPHRVRCPEGHICSPHPNGVQRGQGLCRICKGMKWDAFYIVSGTDRKTGLATVKPGITSGDPRGRTSTHASDGLRTVHATWVDLPDGLAKDTETALLEHLAAAGWTPTRGDEYFPLITLPRIIAFVQARLK